MWRFWNCRFLLVAGAVAAGVVVLALLWPSLGSNRLVIKDPTFHLGFCTITSGTEHTMVSGNKLLARLNEKFHAWCIPRVGDARIYKVKSAEPGIVLGIGYHYDAVSQGADNSLAAAVIQLDGTAVPLTKKTRTRVDAASGEHLCMWLIPEGMTNLAGCELRLSNGGKHVASIRL